MKSKYITLSIALCSILGVSSCDSYLDINPKQVLDQNILNKPSDIEGFVTAAYARMCEMGVIGFLSLYVLVEWFYAFG